MAISLIAKPQLLTPAYNEVKYIYDSTNKNEDGFRYVFDIYNATATKIAEYRVLPDLNGYGEVDLSRLLQTYVSHNFDPTSTEHDADNSYYEYEVEIGEEYKVTYSYTANLTQNGSYTKITYTSQPFSVGDQVIVTDDGANPSFNGLFTVTEANVNDFTVNFLWSQIADATEDGSVVFADNRKSVNRGLVTVSNVFVFNGAIPFANMPTYDYTDYELDNNRDLLVSSIPSEFSATLEQDGWLNFFNNGITTGYVYFENSGGNIFRKTLSTSAFMTQVGVFPNNFGSLTLVSGSGSLIESDTDYYTFWYADSTGTRHSAIYQINLDRRCKINEYEIAFLDRMGSVPSFAFQLRDKLTGKVTKEVYNQNIAGSVTANEWSYDTYEQGRRVIYPSIEETYDLNTNWMTEDEAAYFTELVSSPQTWIKIDDVWFSCVVQDTGYEKERQRNRNLIRKSIKVILSVQDRVNG